ncbi:MAG TPA: heavy metal-binding domain-containing protein [Terriglobia bacterium]|nr:heavy metal-binding domain-containing protein [Terriglobia bacterium]
MRALLSLVILALWVQNPLPDPGAVQDGKVYICPMDPDVRSNSPGKCARCGMALVAGLPDPVEYHMDLTVAPQPPKVGDTTRLTFSIHDPWKDRPVTNFQVVHEKLFHMFVVSQDLQVFLHNHPTLGSDGDFHYDYTFPKAGMYRILGDFYPDGATPQLIAKTVIVPGTPPKPVPLPRDYSAKNAENMQVELVTEPAQPIVGMKTQMIFRVKPGEGLEKYLGAWGHMLVASDDLIDLIHQHPFIADGGPQIQFNVVFPRARPYRVWVQFQRNGVVNTAHFDVPVQILK